MLQHKFQLLEDQHISNQPELLLICNDNNIQLHLKQRVSIK